MLLRCVVNLTKPAQVYDIAKVDPVPEGASSSTTRKHLPVANVEARPHGCLRVG